MALLHEKSCLCVGSQLDLFSVPGTQTSHEKSIYVPYYPLTSLDDGPLEFDIKPSPMYTDLADTRLYLKVKITDVNGANLIILKKSRHVICFFMLCFKKLIFMLVANLLLKVQGFTHGRQE